jgi:hypothetical protein
MVPTESPLAMRTLPLICLVLLSTSFVVIAQDGTSATALEAIKLLPADAAKSVAGIEAPEGTPNPSRWYIQVHDPKEANGLREYVVVGRQLIASRSLSQFAQGLTADDVIGAEAIKLDSDRVSSLVQQYAKANDKPVALMNYQLSRDEEDAIPVWKVTCVNDAGRTVGSLVLTVDKGKVVSHEGFPVEPNTSKEKRSSIPGKARSDGGSPRSTSPRKASSDGQLTKATPLKRAETEEAVPVAEVEPPPRQRGLFQRAGGSLQKIFTGRDAASR